MAAQWFTPEDKLVEALVKLALAQQARGYLDPRDAGSAYDCTILVPQTYEIKYDKASGTSGNLYFEVRNTYRDTPSGLTATRADWWAHYLPSRQRIVLYRPQIMLAFLQQQLADQRPGYRLTLPNGGDHNSQGIVAPIDAILQQPFVTTWPFAIVLPSQMPDLSGMVGQCVQCLEMKAIETLRFGRCLSCQSERS